MKKKEIEEYKREQLLRIQLEAMRIEEENEEKFFGRKKELKILKSFYKNSIDYESQFIAIHGVRRVGKTRLINYFSKEMSKKKKVVLINFLGVYEKTILENIENAGLSIYGSLVDLKTKEKIVDYGTFIEQMFEKGLRLQKEKWATFFFYLKNMLERLDKSVSVFLFFDEISWYSEGNNEFMIDYSSFWNGYCANRKNLMVFMASSAKSWMVNNLIENATGLYGRLNYVIELKPFSLSEIVSLFKEKQWVEDKNEILKYYFIFGGFIKYYFEKQEWINFQLPLKQNVEKINEIYPMLKQEYGRLFKGIFSENKQYLNIVKTLCKSKKSELSEVVEKIEGEFSEKYIYNQLKELEAEGVISSFREDKNTYYQVRLPMLYFYHYWVVSGEKFNTDSGHYYNWQGLMFEMFVFENIETIKKSLEIKGRYNYFLNYLIREKDILTLNKTTNSVLAQIDILLERMAANGKKRKKKEFVLFECKFFNEENLNNLGKIVNEVETKSKYLRQKNTVLKKDKKGNIKESFVMVNKIILSNVEKSGFVNILEVF